MDKKEVVEKIKEDESNAPVCKQAVITDGDKEQSKPVVDGSAEVYIDLEGKSNSGGEQIVRPLILEDSYDATIVGIGLQSLPVFSKTKKDLGKENKLLFSNLIDGQKDKDGNEIVLPMFVKPRISIAYKEGVSNSKLFDLLVNSGLLDAFNALSGKVTEERLRSFLDANLIGRGVRVEVKTVNKNDSSKVSYSRVKDILRFEPVGGKE